MRYDQNVLWFQIFLTWVDVSLAAFFSHIHSHQHHVNERDLKQKSVAAYIKREIVQLTLAANGI